MFDKLTFKDEEKNLFNKYVKLKGTFLHKQIYDILLQANGGSEVTYYELSSFIRYDKNLRDTLYIYLATCEEYLRALILENYDVKEGTKKFSGHCLKRLEDELVPKNDKINSDLYHLLEPDFSALMDICNQLGLTNIHGVKSIKDLRNSTMHHSVILFGHAHDLKEAYENFPVVERQINALRYALPEEYQKGFLSSIAMLNGTHKKYLDRFYLEINDGRICIKK